MISEKLLKLTALMLALIMLLCTVGCGPSGTATVDENGMITAISEGSCNITATSNNGISSSAMITVDKRIPNFMDLYALLDSESWCEIGSDGTWMKLDTNPTDMDSDDFDYTYYQDVFSPCNEKWENSQEADVSIKRALSSGAWDQWDLTLTGAETISIICIPQEDGTITITGTAQYGYAKNYSAYTSGINVGVAECSFTYTGSSLPSSIKDTTGYATIYLSGSTPSLYYSISSSSLLATGTYVYDTLTEAH